MRGLCARCEKMTARLWLPGEQNNAGEVHPLGDVASQFDRPGRLALFMLPATIIPTLRLSETRPFGKVQAEPGPCWVPSGGLGAPSQSWHLTRFPLHSKRPLIGLHS